jgi:uncharacterized protein (DUF1501 family)
MNGCDDFHRTARAPIGVSRRQFLGWGAGAGLSLYTARAMPLQHWLDGAQAANAADPAARILVSVFLPGGLDLCDTFLDTTQTSAYSVARGAAARTAAPGDTLVGSSLSAHPSLGKGQGGGIKNLWNAGKLGLLPGIDYSNPDLSHFHSRHFWETATITGSATTGWLGRWLDRHGDASNPFQGLTAGSRLSPTLLTGGAPVCAVESATRARLTIPGVSTQSQTQAMAAYGNLAQPHRHDGRGRAATRASARFAQNVADRLGPLAANEPPPPEPGDPTGLGEVLGQAKGYPSGSAFGDRLRQLGFLLAQPLGVRIAAVESNADFDTHDNQPARLTKALADVSGSLAAFQADIEARGLGDRVLTFVWTEFGRRLRANQSIGTDHGAGGIGWVMGTRARSGVLTPYPSLKDVDKEGNLRVAVDFRSVYASLVEQWLGTDANGVVPNAANFARLQVVK